MLKSVQRCSLFVFVALAGQVFGQSEALLQDVDRPSHSMGLIEAGVLSSDGRLPTDSLSLYSVCGSSILAGGTPVIPGDLSDEWAEPGTYYNGVSGTGAILKAQLTTAMTSGHIQRAYGDFRYSAVLHDADPNQPGNILLVYNRASVPATWDSGSTWNREHVWPQSLQPGSASNSSTGNLGDPHALLPCNPGINSSRGNKPFGNADTTGGFGSLGTYYFPGDSDKGDVARSLFYSATRWSSLGISLTNGFPGTNQMGDLGSQVAWHYLDIPDAFERRRNHVIYSQPLNPSYYTNNRNAYVDLPGAVWSVFVDNLNDSQLWLGGTAASDGSSSVEVCVRGLASVAPPASEVTLNRGGADGTYYAVAQSGDAISDQPLHNGFTGAFAINDSAARTFEVGIDPAAVSGPGLYTGAISVDNLDMTNGLGLGFGMQDANDVVTVSYEALAPSSASLSDSGVVTQVELDMGRLVVGIPATFAAPLFSMDPVAGYTAGVQASGGSLLGQPVGSTLTFPNQVIQPGQSSDIEVSFTPAITGSLSFSAFVQTGDDLGVFGAESRGEVRIDFVALVTLCLADTNADGVLDNGDIGMFVNLFLAGDMAADISGDGVLDNGDIGTFVAAFLAGC
ncbi:MAG: endonuclease I [Phycisphaerales bacterium]|jgi:endonuclease I